MIDLYEIAESDDDWIHSIEGVEEVLTLRHKSY